MHSELVIPGNIILRQRGTKYHIAKAGDTVGIGRDHTIYSKIEGYVAFKWNKYKRRQFVYVAPVAEGNPYQQSQAIKPTADAQLA